jgi:hypothetical protein
MSSIFEIRQVYDFDVYASALLGTNFNNVTILAIMDRSTAEREIDVQAMHAQIYPLLPANTAPNDPDGYDYVKIKTVSGETTILGLPWIKTDTIALVEARTIVATFGNAKASDVARIRDMCSQNGFSLVSVVVT